ncbi:hypothetical protein [Rhodopirellula bahusiensis]|uniref:hypothetical protein n=1 Tax=Rhodopirellula bahusiensis TaxID=2014065 RepID=UPI0032665F24
MTSTQTYGTDTITFAGITFGASSRWQTQTISLFEKETPATDAHGSLDESFDRIEFDDFDCEAVSIAVGPLESPINLETVQFHPRKWTVVRIIAVRAEIVGYFDRESARREAERLVKAGDRLMVGTPYLASRLVVKR